MFAYCGNNPISHSDPTGQLFFTALGAVTGFISGALTAMASKADKETWLETAYHSAVGGAIAGAGVDAGLLILGTAGTATPIVAAVATAYILGGAGNVYATYATSNGNASGSDYLGSSIIGGTFSVLSFATGLGAISNLIDGIFIQGTSELVENFWVGLGIGVSTSIATSIGIAADDKQTTKSTGKMTRIHLE